METSLADACFLSNGRMVPKRLCWGGKIVMLLLSLSASERNALRLGALSCSVKLWRNQYKRVQPVLEMF